MVFVRYVIVSLVMQKKCIICNKTYNAKQERSLYCSDACRQKKFRKRHNFKVTELRNTVLATQTEVTELRNTVLATRRSDDEVRESCNQKLRELYLLLEEIRLMIETSTSQRLKDKYIEALNKYNKLSQSNG